MIAFYIALPIALAVFGNFRKWSAIPLMLLGIISIAITSSLILYASESRWRRLEKALYAYDIDGDGHLSNEELVPKALMLRDAYTADTGRGTGPVIKGFMAMIYTFVSFGFIGLLFRIRKEDVPDKSVSLHLSKETVNKEVGQGST